MTKYNWKSTGPGGCDNHCIESPCGPCITGRYQPYSKLEEELIETLEKISQRLEEYGPFTNGNVARKWAREAIIKATRRTDEQAYDKTDYEP